MAAINRLLGTALDEEDFKILQPYLQVNKYLSKGPRQLAPNHTTLSGYGSYDNFINNKKVQNPIEYDDINFDTLDNQLELKSFFVFFLISPEFSEFYKKSEPSNEFEWLALGLEFGHKSILEEEKGSFFADRSGVIPEEIKRLRQTAISLYRMEISELIQEAIKIGAKF